MVGYTKEMVQVYLAKNGLIYSIFFAKKAVVKQNKKGKMYHCPIMLKKLSKTQKL